MSTSEHEKLFDEICSKLNELSHREDNVGPQSQKIDRMQTQIKKFQDDLQETHTELLEKIRSLEGMQVQQNDLNGHLKQLSDQLQNERNINSKLNADLAKALEMSLQLQLEIQGLKSRSAQVQNEEKKFSQALQEKLKITQRDLELAQALRDEASLELSKAKNNFLYEQEKLLNSKLEVESQLSKQKLEFELNEKTMLQQREEILRANQELLDSINKKDDQIQNLNQKIEELSQSLNILESSARDQQNMLKTLSDVAESKIVEMKLALDKKTVEGQDYYGHLQQALTQSSLLKQENIQLKEYIAKVNAYLQGQTQLNQSK